MKKIFALAIFATFLFSSSCTKDKIDGVDCSTVTFSETVFPIIQQNCNLSGCHGAGSAQINYTSYDSLSVVVDNGKFETMVLVDRSMPQGGGSLTDEELAQLQCWIDAGAPE